MKTYHLTTAQGKNFLIDADSYERNNREFRFKQGNEVVAIVQDVVSLFDNTKAKLVDLDRQK